MVARGLCLLLFALLAFGPQLTHPDWKGTEGRRVQIAMEMARSGDYMVPTLGWERTLAKPPLFYWCLAGLQELFGPSPIAMRLPSVIGFWLLAWLALAVFRREFGEGAGWVAALAVLGSPVLLHDGPTAEIDPLFSSLTAVSLFLLAFGVARRRRETLVAAGVVGGMAILTKGPPYLLFAAFPLLVWWRHRRMWGWWAYLASLLLVPLAYYLPLWAFRVDPESFLAVAGEESVGRLQFLEWERVLGTPLYLLRAGLLMLPFGLWSAYEFRSSRDVRMGDRDLMLRMCMSAAVSGVLLLALFPGRPTRYLLPAVPLFLFAVAPAVAHYARVQRELTRFPRRLLAFAGLLASAGLVAVPFLPFPFPGRAPALLLALAMGPILVRTPRQLVAFCIAVPVLGAWTVIPDRADYMLFSGRARAPMAEVLVPEMERLGATEDLQTLGHMHSAVLVRARLVPPGDELRRRAPTARWLLLEDADAVPEATPKTPGYVDRLRVRVSDRSFVLRQRTGDGR